MILNKDAESGLTITEIWTKLKKEHAVRVTRKTVQRDIIELSEAYKILSTESMPFRYFADGKFKPDYQLSLSESELQAVLIALENLKNTGHPYFKKICKEAEVGIFSRLPRPLSEALRESKSSLYFNTGTIGRPISIDTKSFEIVMKALRLNKCFKCRNHSPYKSNKYNRRIRKFAPLIFNMADQVPYLIVEDLDDGEVKRLRITRLTNVELLDLEVDKGKIKRLKNLQSSFGGWGGKDEEAVLLKIHCDKKVATFFSEREIHPSQKIKKLKEESFIVELEVAASNEIPRFLASFGSGIKMIEPSSIWDEVLKIWESVSAEVS